jgi:predicted RNA-binding protein associated with RNAse of E/G family
MTTLFRKRLIPSECIHLKDDQIVYQADNKIITTWTTLHPKLEFSHGASYYCLDEGWKISKFYRQDNTLAYIYCDIIDTSYDKENDTYVFTDLLADVIIENNGFVRVVDLDELADACSIGIISNDMLVLSLHRLNNLLSIIYSGEFNDNIETLETYEKH